MKLVWRFAAITIANLGFSEIVSAQAPGGGPAAYLNCYVSGAITSPLSWLPCSTTNPLAVSVSGMAPGSTVAISQTTPGTTNGVSLAYIGANVVSSGNGIAGTGSQRVTIASDNTPFTVNSAQSGTWTVQPGNTANTTPWLVNLASGTAVIGHVITDSGSVTAASQSGAWSVTANAGTNLNTSLLALESGGNLATLAGTVTSSRIAVNLISGQSGVTGGSGVTGAATQRVTLATDVPLPTGSNTLGAVTQASGPWTQNVTQFGSTNVSTGTGTGGAGIPRVTVSNDSAVRVWDGTNTATVKAASTAAAATDTSVVVTPSPNTGIVYASTSALAANLVAKGSAGNLVDLEVSADATLAAADWWIMVFDATSAPADGAVTPVKCYYMPATTTTFFTGFTGFPKFNTGITISISTTGCFTKTASTHAFISGNVQ